jgi:hypothetical protein
VVLTSSNLASVTMLGDAFPLIRPSHARCDPNLFLLPGAVRCVLDAPDRKSDQMDHVGYELGMVYAGCSSVVGSYGIPYRIRTGVAAVRGLSIGSTGVHSSSEITHKSLV